MRAFEKTWRSEVVLFFGGGEMERDPRRVIRTKDGGGTVRMVGVGSQLIYCIYVSSLYDLTPSPTFVLLDHLI